MPTALNSIARRDLVIEIYQPTVVQIVRRAAAVLPSTIDREDLTQIGNVALIAASAEFEAYVRTRIRGAVIDAGRKAYRDEKCVRIDEFPEFAADEIPPETVIFDKARRRRAKSAIRLLPADERQVLELKSKGATTREIAKAVGVSPRTVIRRHVAGVAAARLLTMTA